MASLWTWKRKTNSFLEKEGMEIVRNFLHKMTTQSTLPLFDLVPKFGSKSSGNVPGSLVASISVNGCTC
ncbi:hypothetical protein SCA6_004046 [Theobroma cacao]